MITTVTTVGVAYSPTLLLYEFLILSVAPLSHYYLRVNDSRLNITSACN